MRVRLPVIVRKIIRGTGPRNQSNATLYGGPVSSYSYRDQANGDRSPTDVFVDRGGVLARKSNSVNVLECGNFSPQPSLTTADPNRLKSHASYGLVSFSARLQQNVES